MKITLRLGGGNNASKTSSDGRGGASISPSPSPSNTTTTEANNGVDNTTRTTVAATTATGKKSRKSMSANSLKGGARKSMSLTPQTCRTSSPTPGGLSHTSPMSSASSRTVPPSMDIEEGRFLVSKTPACKWTRRPVAVRSLEGFELPFTMWVPADGSGVVQPVKDPGPDRDKLGSIVPLPTLNTKLITSHGTALLMQREVPNHRSGHHHHHHRSVTPQESSKVDTVSVNEISVNGNDAGANSKANVAASSTTGSPAGTVPTAARPKKRKRPNVVVTGSPAIDAPSATSSVVATTKPGRRARATPDTDTSKNDGDDKRDGEENNTRSSSNNRSSTSNTSGVKRIRVGAASSSKKSNVPLTCPHSTCHMQYRTVYVDRAELRAHLEAVHGRALICDECGRACIDQTKLRRHQVSCRGERPFLCPVGGCNKRFSLDFNMKSHVRAVHVNEKKCNICSMIFRNDKKLEEHMLSHTQHTGFASESANNPPGGDDDSDSDD